MTKNEIIESVVIVLSIPLLWPVVRATHGGPPVSPLFKVLLVAAVVALVVVAIRRVQRIRLAFKDRNGPRGPFPPGV